MVTACATPLAAADLMRLYGKIRFTWNLRTDQLAWNGPISKLFGNDANLSTGSNFLSRLTTECFWKRFSDIDTSLKKEAKPDSYSAEYTVTLPDRSHCSIIEEGTLIRNARGLPERLEGSIRVGEDKKADKDYSGYDRMTGFASQEVVHENLAALFEQTKGEIAPGGYLVFCIDKLSLIYFLYGLDALRESLIQVGKTLNKFTRFNDFMGRISGCCFGSVLRDTDEWGVFQAAHRLVESCSNLKIETPIETFSPTVSVGGAAFRTGVTPLEVIQQAERGLFEMQCMKGAGVIAKTQTAANPTIERPTSNDPSHRRLADEKRAVKRAGKVLNLGEQ